MSHDEGIIDMNLRIEDNIREEILESHIENALTQFTSVLDIVEKDIEIKKQESLVLSDKAYDIRECQICFENLGEVNNMVLRCGHKYCTDCFLKYFQTDKGEYCPCCRQKIAIKINPHIKKQIENDLRSNIIPTNVTSRDMYLSRRTTLNNWLNSEDETHYDGEDESLSDLIPDSSYYFSDITNINTISGSQSELNLQMLADTATRVIG
jgi:hypothetical protein